MKNIFGVVSINRKGSDQFNGRTFEDRCVRDGEAAQESLKELAKKGLKQEGFDENTALPVDQSKIREEIRCQKITEDEKSKLESQIEEIVNKYNENRNDGEQIKEESLIQSIEVEENTVYASVDGIQVHKQKEERKEGSTRDKRFIENYVVYVKSIEGTYRFVTDNLMNALIILLGYLFLNNLLNNRNLIFFTDGAKNIKNGINQYFGFREFTIYLDWFHIIKRSNESFSMALKGGKANIEANRELKREFAHRLWPGNIDDCIDFLNNIDKDRIKNQQMLDSIKDYLNNRRSEIGCFALRKKLGLLNSSNRVEQSNQLLVARREKNQGMSWSKQGSLALASLIALMSNKEHKDWLRKGSINFTPVPPVTAKAA